ncbi:hypothetical protein M404DRAFT_996179 [Pisolithus tinctorius Marx 270]|uniref:Uncharacterized protein n=1 Tax=Pisolithus tinctorius Marx 270 TaxID=870435 RepID=A0A0C3KIH0_PISTI|nr:hypothetical protein M404DRAFT_996179 [Pisolithus tinctorius Marx 270]
MMHCWEHSIDTGRPVTQHVLQARKDDLQYVVQRFSTRYVFESDLCCVGIFDDPCMP